MDQRENRSDRLDELTRFPAGQRLLYIFTGF